MCAGAAGWLQDAIAGVGWTRAGRGLVALVAPSLAVTLALYVALARVMGWGAARIRWPIGTRAIRSLVIGAASGAGLAAAVLALAVVGGARIVIGEPLGESYLAVALPLAAGLVLAAALEELLFRGFPLARLAEAVGPMMAAAVLSVLFAVVHIGNPDVSPVGLVNIGLASLFLSAVFFGPGGLAAAIGVHIGWNAMLALGADAPVSGLRFALPALEYFPGPRSVISGGRFGPEGGLAATAVLVPAVVWWTRRNALVTKGRER